MEKFEKMDLSLSEILGIENEYELDTGDLIIVPKGVYHNVIH